jgi:DtxR family Mn-dependent transcriptional regulator
MATLAVVPEGFHPPVEEYLKAIYELEEEGVPVIRARLAERLRHTPPAVTEMVLRLIADGFIEGDEGSQRSLKMTEQGFRRAESVVRRHRLAERLLIDIIGLDWNKAHLEAERWEHVISDEVEPRLVALLHNPETCPHGNPIPGSGAPIEAFRALSGAQAGQRVRLRRISECVEIELETLTYLDSHGFRPGTSANVIDKAPDGTLTLKLESGGDTFAVGPNLAVQLFVDEPDDRQEA